MSTLPQNPSESFKASNRHLWPDVGSKASPAGSAAQETINKRMRQSSKPLLNKLEAEFLSHIKTLHPNWQMSAQAVTFKLANGLRYTPDFVCLDTTPVIAYEVKGKWVDGDSFPKLKMAASVYPTINWFLVWREGHSWCEQSILP